MQIITGKTDTAHVRAEDDRALHAGTFGTGAYILNVGSRLSATIETANNITLADGELMFQGTHARIRFGETETCIIENGVTGYNRIDLIVARYTQTAGLEQMELAVIKGEATAGEPVTPAYTSGNILEGATLAEVPLYAVRLSGVNVTNVVSQLPVLTTTMDNIYTKEEEDAKILAEQKRAQQELSDSIANIRKELTNLITSNTNAINAINGTLDTHGASIATLNGNVSALSTADANLSTSIGNNAFNITQHNTRITNTEAEINSLKNRVGRLESNLEGPGLVPNS